MLTAWSAGTWAMAQRTPPSHVSSLLMPLSPHPRRTLLAGSIILAFCVAVIVLGAFAAGAALPPNSNISLAEALAAALRAPPAAAYHGKGGLIVLVVVPVMVGMWLAYAANGRDRAARRRVLMLTWPALVLAAFCIGQFYPCFVSPIVCVTLPIGLLFLQTDGETFTLALICWIAVGWWIWTLALIGWLDSRRERPAHLCPTCNYDRTGLDPAARCPECGQTRLEGLLGPNQK